MLHTSCIHYSGVHIYQYVCICNCGIHVLYTISFTAVPFLRVPDSVTGLPTLALQGRGRLAVFPVVAIRRQVHMYHQCPQQNGEGAGSHFHCGPQRDQEGSRKWRHNFRLASPGSGGNDKYILNEVHHSINQDTFL
ncbi:unnamed protein product [Pylaiella littoralis]